MSTPKFKIKDRIRKIKSNECITHLARYSQVAKAINKNINRCGTIIDCITKKNKRGRAYFYYHVLWEDTKTISLHCQNRLLLEKDL